MEWAEELKLSIRKTTARKGRRSNSRNPEKKQSSTSTTSADKDIALDISVELAQPNANIIASSSSTADSEIKRPPRRILGGWADTGHKLLKNKTKNLAEDERFRNFVQKSVRETSPDEDIPIIPDLDDVKDDVVNEKLKSASVIANRTLLHSDLLSQNAFSAIEGVDLTILTRCLQAPDSLDEPDEVWDWDKLFTDVIAEIHSDKSQTCGRKIEIAADELMPTRT